MTNPDTNTLNGALEQLGTTMANNLISMGITDATPNDGLTTLSNRILDIEPSIGGLDLDTAVTLSANSSTIYQSQSLILTSKLTASYDDETLVDVDLKGVLQNATVYFKEGNTLIGTGITDTDGICTCTIDTLSVGSHTIKAIFEGTDNFKSCESTTLTITVSTLNLDHITLVSDKSILSHADGESAILTATLKDSNDSTISVDNINIDIYKDNTKISTLQTVNGVASYTYNSQGVGDVVFYAGCEGILLTKTYDIVDAKYYNSLTSDDGHWSGNNVSFSYSNNGMKMTASNWGDTVCDVTFDSPVSIQWEITTTPTPSFYFSIREGTTSKYGGRWDSNGMKIDTPSPEVNTGSTSHIAKYEIKVLSNGNAEIYKNESLLDTKTNISFSSAIFDWGYGGSRNITVKNFLIKPL